MAGCLDIETVVTSAIEYLGSKHRCHCPTPSYWKLVHQRSAGQVGRDQLDRVGVALVVGGPPAQEKGVEEVFSLAEGDVWKDRAAGAE